MAGRGDDVIYAVNDGEPDEVFCGDGVDRVVYDNFVDPKDLGTVDSHDVPRNCETEDAPG